MSVHAVFTKFSVTAEQT